MEKRETALYDIHLAAGAEVLPLPPDGITAGW